MLLTLRATYGANLVRFWKCQFLGVSVGVSDFSVVSVGFVDWNSFSRCCRYCVMVGLSGLIDGLSFGCKK